MAHVSNKRHLRNITIPKTWPISRKKYYWIIRPQQMDISLNMVCQYYYG